MVPLKSCDKLLVDIQDAADLLSSSDKHLDGLVRQKLMPEPVYLGRRKLWSVDGLRQWVEQGCPPQEQATSNDAK